ncbi:uncharacterized protein LOC135832297 isoform X1 [Planococcus citri]|uniref:uncharacterized protein LOC135832297 isoform X1 n=1 Tax=Planococcus citri TaxID=170843 RepID=UPI0031F77E44
MRVELFIHTRFFKTKFLKFIGVSVLIINVHVSKLNMRAFAKILFACVSIHSCCAVTKLPTMKLVQKVMLPESNETEIITSTLAYRVKVENSTKIAVVSYGGIFRAPYIAEVFNNWTMGRGLELESLIECDAFGIIDPFALNETDPTVIHLLASEQILYRGKPLALFQQETMKYYDYILATDKKSWFTLRDLAPQDMVDKIELLSLYDPYRRGVDMPDIFFAMYRRDSGRKFQWMTSVIRQTVKTFMITHLDGMKYRAGLTTTTTTTTSRVTDSLELMSYHDHEEMNDDINAEFDYTVPAF